MISSASFIPPTLACQKDTPTTLTSAGLLRPSPALAPKTTPTTTDITAIIQQPPTQKLLTNNTIESSLSSSISLSRNQSASASDTMITFSKNQEAEEEKSKEEPLTCFEGEGNGNETDIYKELLESGHSDDFMDYTATLWQKPSWNVPTNLRGPLVHLEFDPHLERFYEALQHTLYETGLPETIDMTGITKINRDSHDQVTIAVLSSPVECMSILLTGGEQCPGDMLIVLSHTWCTKRASPILPEKYSLYVHQAVAFYKGGYTFLERYDPPRRVTYFVNYLTNTCTGGVCSDGEQLEKGLDCPMSSSLKLNLITDDKLYTRIVLGKAGVRLPVTLAFPFKITDQMYDNDLDDVTIVPIHEDITEPLAKTLVWSEINKFVTQIKDADFNKLVVKPSGVSWYGSKFVSFHDKTDVEGINAAVENVMANLQQGDSVLVEEYIAFQQPSDQQQSNFDNKYNVRIRSTVCRTSNDKAKTTQITCGIGVSSQPINGDNTIPCSLELFLKVSGFSDDQIEDIHTNIKMKSERTMEALMRNEKEFSEEKRGEIGAQTDIIGIDLILKREGRTYDAVVIEVNSHDCMINCQIYEFINPNKRHEASTDLVQTMIARSNQFLVKSKTLIVIGIGSYSKWFIFEEAKALEIKVVLVDTDLQESMPKVPVFIQQDLTNLRNIEKTSAEIIRKLHSRQIYADGCVSFWEDFAPIAASICDKLKLVGSPFRSAMIAKNKFLTHQILARRTGDIPHFPRTYLYTSKTKRIDSLEDIQRAIRADSISLPCVLKLLYGSSAVGVHLVNNEKECLQYFDDVQQKLDTYGVGLGFGSSMMLTNFVSGTEHDVDVIIFKRKLVAAFVSDNGPTRVPNFLETVAVMPSILDDEKKNQLITTAYQCCLEVGLENGVFNVELMMTTLGPKLLEINARMGGFYLRDWIKQCYDVDILLSVFLIAFGIRPHVCAKKASKSLVGVMCIPSEHQDLFRSKEFLMKLQKKHRHGSILYKKFEKEPLKERFEQVTANIAAFGPNAGAAKKSLIELCQELQISSATYDIEKMLSFVPS